MVEKKLNKKLDPILAGYRDENGNQYRLSKQIFNEVEDLSFIYIERNGKQPSRQLIRSWIARLNLAYHEMIITEKDNE